jgi:hypothetical protein
VARLSEGLFEANVAAGQYEIETESEAWMVVGGRTIVTVVAGSNLVKIPIERTRGVVLGVQDRTGRPLAVGPHDFELVDASGTGVVAYSSSVGMRRKYTCRGAGVVIVRAAPGGSFYGSTKEVSFLLRAEEFDDIQMQLN